MRRVFKWEGGRVEGAKIGRIMGPK